MGTINYGTNKILCSLGYHNEFDYDDDLIKECREEFDLDEENYTNDDIIDRLREDYNMCEEDDYFSVQTLINSKDFHFYKVELCSGYYDGFYISLDREYCYLDNYKAKLEMQKELTMLKTTLIDIITNYGVRVCYPGWGTSWEEKIEDSIKVLNEKVKEERKAIKQIPTDIQVCKMSDAERIAKIGWTW